MVFRSYGQKLTGKRINSVVGKASIVGNRIPMKRQTSMADEDHVNIVCIGDGREPLLGVECPDKMVVLDHLRGVFRDDEVFDASVKDGCLHLTKGKNSYWFHLVDNFDKDVVCPKLDSDTRFRMDPRKLSKRYGKDVKGGYAKFVADVDSDGHRTVRAFIYDGSDRLVDCILLGTSWTGEASVSRYPMDYIRDMDRLGGEVVIGMSTDYPLVADTLNEDVKVQYLLAPRIGFQDEDTFHYESEQEEEWVSSHNRSKRTYAPRKDASKRRS